MLFKQIRVFFSSFMEHKCNFCNYITFKLYNLKRHQNNKHLREIFNKKSVENMCENVSQIGENVSPIGENVSPTGENVSPTCENVSHKFICKKCNKIYNSNRYLKEHEKKCIGVDDLTCPRCMISFTTRQAKSKHVNKNNCKPRSVIHARIPNQQNIENQINNNITNNNIENQINNNIQNQNINNNIIINNYKNERLDYLTYDKMLTVFKKIYNSPTLLTKEIHFNYEFPENNNIQFEDKTRALVKVNDELVLKDLNTLAEELAKEKGDKVKQFAEDNEIEICKDMEKAKYKEILDLIFTYLILKEPKEEYRLQVKNIKDMIVTSKIKLSKYGS